MSLRVPPAGGKDVSEWAPRTNPPFPLLQQCICPQTSRSPPAQPPSPQRSLQQLGEIQWVAQGRPLRGQETSAQALGTRGKAKLVWTRGLNQEQQMEVGSRGGGGSGGEG